MTICSYLIKRKYITGNKNFQYYKHAIGFTKDAIEGNRIRKIGYIEKL